MLNLRFRQLPVSASIDDFHRAYGFLGLQRISGQTDVAEKLRYLFIYQWYFALVTFALSGFVLVVVYLSLAELQRTNLRWAALDVFTTIPVAGLFGQNDRILSAGGQAHYSDAACGFFITVLALWLLVVLCSAINARLLLVGFPRGVFSYTAVTVVFATIAWLIMANGSGWIFVISDQLASPYWVLRLLVLSAEAFSIGVYLVFLVAAVRSFAAPGRMLSS